MADAQSREAFEGDRLALVLTAARAEHHQRAYFFLMIDHLYFSL